MPGAGPARHAHGRLPRGRPARRAPGGLRGWASWEPANATGNYAGKAYYRDSLAGVAVAAFGLGDSGYLKYNAVAKRLANRLAGLGAEALVEKGLGDDQARAGYEAALDPWLEAFWRAVEVRFGVQAMEGVVGSLDMPKFSVTFLEEGPRRSQAGMTAMEEAAGAAAAFHRVADAAAGLPAPADDPRLAAAGPHAFGPGRPYMARMLKNERLTSPGHFQDVRHIEFDLGDSSLTYSPGDLLVILPETPSSAVDAFLERAGLDGDRWVSVRPAGLGAQAEAPGGPQAQVRIRALVQGALDVHGASPRRYFFDVLRRFAAAQHEADRLAYFASAEGRDDLHLYCSGEGRTVLEVLGDFKSSSPPLEWLLQCVPAKRPRQFSISSSPTAHPRAAHITAAIVEWRTPFGRTKRGLCTAALAAMEPGRRDDRVPVWIEAGAMRMPPNDGTPMVLIGPGTGVAPFRSFLQERMERARGRADHHSRPTGPRGPSPESTGPKEQAIESAGPKEAAIESTSLKERDSKSLPVAPSWLLFGCRNEAGDFLYRGEWEALRRAGVLDGIITAFSRDQPSKVYVTHRIRERGALIWRLIGEAGAVVYVSGSARKMPADVMSAIEAVVAEHTGRSTESAKRFVKAMEASGRYVVESWS
eukprot:evm.model.scf_1778.4 EVM.evm.TU.scf_1778.4   scf_1778:10727-13876(+)